MSGPSLDNLAFVQSEFEKGGFLVGTGYFVRPGLVLTARHVVEPDEGHVNSVRVRHEGSAQWFEADLQPAWENPGIDAVLISLGESRPESIDPVDIRSSTELDSDHWESVAYPTASAELDEDGKPNYSTAGLGGTFYTLGGYGQAERYLELGVEHPPNHSDGISGAPIFVNDFLVGLIDSSPKDFGEDRLHGVPVERFVDDAAFITAINPSPNKVPRSDRWYLVLLAEKSSPLTEKYIVNGLDLLERRLQNADAEEAIKYSHLVLRVSDEIHSVESWLHLVQLVSSAPVLVIDVTDFEPATMIVLGVRAVSRRGLTVLATKQALDQSHLADLPFNVKESRLVSLAGEGGLGPEQLRDALWQGLVEQRLRSDYLDLPAYEAIRVPRQELPAEVLILCSFDKSYDPNWKCISWLVRILLNPYKGARVLDYGSPRLVSQALYEQIRWNTRCIVDLTGWRPNVLFELGVRLACSPFDPLMLLAGETYTPSLAQVSSILSLLGVTEYMVPDSVKSGDSDEPDEAFLTSSLDDAFAKYDQRVRREDVAKGSGVLAPGVTFSMVESSFDWKQEGFQVRPDQALRAELSALLGRDWERAATETDVLFAANRDFADAIQQRVRETWVAAWQYAHSRFGRLALDGDLEAREQLVDLGELVRRGLGDAHQELSEEIRVLIRKW